MLSKVNYKLGICSLKIIFLAAVICLFLAPDLKAGRIEDKDGKTIIHVVVDRLPDPTRTDTFNRSEVAAVKEFEKRFPAIFAEKYRDKYKAHPEKYGRHNWDNVEIELERFAGIQVSDVEVDLLAIAGGVGPDVLYVNFRKSHNYIHNRFLYPLDKPEDGYFSDMTEEEIDFRVHPKIWPVIKRKGPEGEKHIWSIPYGGALGKVLLFRKDLFDEKNIPYPTMAWTWDDLIDAAKKITDPARGIYGLRLTRGEHESWNWISFLWSAGGEVMEYNEETDQWKCVFDTREAAMALDFYIRISAEKWIDKDGKVRRGYSAKDTSDAWGKWDRGEIGMHEYYIDERVFQTINPEVTGMVPVPLGPTGIRGAELNSRMMGLFAEIKDPAVRDAAWEYIKFYECKDAVAIKTRIMVEGGFGPFVNPKYLRMFGYPEVERLAPKGWSDVFDVAIATGKTEPYGKNSNLAYHMMTLPIQKAEQLALNNRLTADPEERLDVMQDLLKQYCARANDEMIGIVTPGERLKRRVSAAIFLVSLILVFTFVFRKIIKTFTPLEVTGEERKKTWDFAKYKWAYVLMLPALLTILVWQYIPLFFGSVMAFYDYKLIGKSTWVGLDNFGDVLYDVYWWTSVWHALRYSFLTISFTFIPPIVLAVLLQEVPKGKIAYRLIYYLPAVTTGVVTALLWKQFYEQSENGALNALALKIPAIGFLAAGLLLMGLAFMFVLRLKVHGMYGTAVLFAFIGIFLFLACGNLAAPILFPGGESVAEILRNFLPRLIKTVPEPYRWLGDPDVAMMSCVIPMVWAGMGPGCLIYLAALKGIPEDFYEAADIDGATFIDKIMFVVAPSLKALIIINFVEVFIASWYGASGNILVMTGGGANTEIAGLHIWYKAFTFLKFGPAAVMAWMLGFMLIGFTVNQLKVLSRVEFRTTGEK